MIEHSITMKLLVTTSVVNNGLVSAIHRTCIALTEGEISRIM